MLLICLNFLINDAIKCSGVYDSGSNISLMNIEFANKNGIKFSKCDKNFSMVSGTADVFGKTMIKVKMFSITMCVEVFVIKSKNFKYDFLIGLDLIHVFKLCQDNNLNISQFNFDINKENNKNLVLPNNPDTQSVFVNFNEFIKVNNFEANLDHLTKDQGKKIADLINKHKSIFAKDKFDTGTVREHEACIKLLEHKYVSRKPYRCSLDDQKEIEAQVSQLLRHGLIEDSTLPFVAPVTLVNKKDEFGNVNKNRLCVDFTFLNKLVVPESQPFPLIEDLIVKTRDCTFFSVFDINSAFWAIPLRVKDKYKTGFVTQSGHYNWTCLPFGLKTSPAIFQRILRNIIRKHELNDFCVNYIDDVLIFSRSFKEHLAHIDKLFTAIKVEGFRLKLLKCNFARSNVKYLGHIIGNNLTRPVTDNIKSIRDFPVPQNKKNIRQFLGKVNFYKKYIPRAAQILEPLHNLLRKYVNFDWSSWCQKSFDKVKSLLCSSPCLAIFNPLKETILQTDASTEGIGAVLKQRQSNGDFKPIGFFSKKLNAHQKNKKAVYLECLAIKEALMFWQHWLLGKDFVVLTDHKPLVGLKINSKFDRDLTNLMFYLSQFNFIIKYVPGSSNQEADCLSRNPVLETYENINELRVVNFLQLNELILDQSKLYSNLTNMKNVIQKNNLLFLSFKTGNRILISEDLAVRLIKEVHINFGHIGARQVALHVFPYYYCKNFFRIITNFCKKCSVCIKNKSRVPVKYGLLSQLGPASKPGEIMSLDSIGGFNGNNSPKRFLHLLVDHFTRYAYIFTSRTQKSSDFIHLVQKVLNQGLKINTLLADQYGGINSSEFKRFLHNNNINLIFTAVDCPFSNGLNERLNQTLVNRIRCKLNENSINQRKAWSLLAEDCVNEYNKTIHTSTGFSLGYLLNGTNVNICPPSINISKIRSLQEDRKLAFLRSNKVHDNNKKKYDRNRKNITYKVHDLVYVNHGNILNKNKLDEIRTGPFSISEKISNVIYRVNDGYQKKRVQFISCIKIAPLFALGFVWGMGM